MDQAHEQITDLRSVESAGPASLGEKDSILVADFVNSTGDPVLDDMAGVDLSTIAQLLGNKTLQMVLRYSHLSQSHELAAVARLCKTGEGNKKRSDTRSDTGAIVG